jgi:hypothetical protein
MRYTTQNGQEDGGDWLVTWTYALSVFVYLYISVQSLSLAREGIYMHVYVYMYAFMHVEFAESALYILSGIILNYY